MTRPEASASAIQIRSLSLLEASFERAEELPEGQPQVNGHFNLTASDPAEGRVRADLTVDLGDVNGSWSARVHYVLVLERTRPLPEGTDEEDYWSMIREQTAAVIMYPFVRETIVGLLLKAGLPPAMPPIIDFSQAKRTETADEGEPSLAEQE